MVAYSKHYYCVDNAVDLLGNCICFGLGVCDNAKEAGMYREHDVFSISALQTKAETMGANQKFMDTC